MCWLSIFNGKKDAERIADEAGETAKKQEPEVVPKVLRETS